MFAQLAATPVSNNVLCFTDKDSYDALLNSDENTMQNFYTSLQNHSGFTSLNQSIAVNDNHSSIPDSVIEDVDFLGNILNNQGVVKIGTYFYKIDFTNDKVFVLHQDKAGLYFNDLLNGNVTTANELGSFDLESEAIELTELGYKTEPSGDIREADRLRIFCWGRHAAKGNSPEWGLYFLDESRPDFSVFERCINVYGSSTPSTNTRLNIKLTYLRLGIYFTLYVKGKMQHETGNLIVNGDAIWETASADDAETRWAIAYKTVYKGKCRGDEEIRDEATLYPPTATSSDKNKVEKIFWRKSTGLTYYCMRVESALFLKKASIGPADEQNYCFERPQIFVIPTPRTVHSTEIYPNRVFKIDSNLDCQ